MRGASVTRGILAAVLLTAALFGQASAEPVRRALLVGVSEYPKASVGDAQLEGPKNDVALLIRTLPLIGIREQDTIILADALEKTDAPRKADGMPTRAAILAGLEHLARESQKDDFALVYLSGHGSRQPDLAPEKRAVPKADGLDEMFLPIDIGVWDDGVTAVENALIDYDFGKAIDRIRAKGAHVWVIVDACHSGSMTRSVGDAVAKQVPMDRLGVPAAAIARARAAAEARAAQLNPRTRSTTAPTPKSRSTWGSEPPTSAQLPAKAGSYVAFFAAYPDQQALQQAMPPARGVPGKKPYSVMTWYLVQAIQSGRASTYRDLAAQVIAGYEGFGKSPMPMFEGDLNRPVSEREAAGTQAERRYMARKTGDRLTLDGGAADGLSAGAVVALALADKPDEVVGHGEIVGVGLAQSALQPVAHAGRETRLADIPKDTALVAGIVEKGVELRLAVAFSAPDTPSSPEEQAVKAAMTKSAAPNLGAAILAGSPVEADILFRIEDGRLWFVPGQGALEKSGRERTPSVSLAGIRDEADGARLIQRHVARLAKTRNLIRTASAMGVSAVAEKVKIEAFLLRDERQTPAGARAPDDRRCLPREQQVPAAAIPLGSGGAELALPEIRHCDQVYFRLAAIGNKPMDITPLYVDGEGLVSYHGPHTGLRLEPRAIPTVLALNLRSYNPEKGQPEAIGLERLLFLAVEVPERQALAADFRYLADPQLTRSTAGGPPALRAFLESAAFARGATRSATSAPRLDGAAAGIVEYRWRVVAPDGAQ